ncbi:MAG: hypothetical protein Q8K58_02435 [Acidimicrobiales bacterium]|nr:hypothetical protein [Acidimicrobiales bacterium]
MRPHRSFLTALVTTALLAACGDGGDGSGLSDREQEFADSFAVSLTEEEDGLDVTDDEATCMGEAIMAELGAEPFEEADLEPEDVEGEDSPGQLLGDGAVSDDQADAILTEWEDCVELTEAYVESAAGEFDLDEDGKACLEEGLREDDLLTTLLRSGFTQAEDEPDEDQIAPFVQLVQTCSESESGEGGLLVDSIAESLSADGSLSEEDAQCVAQFVVDELGSEQLLESGDLQNASPEVQAQFTAALTAAATECGVSLPGIGG